MNNNIKYFIDTSVLIDIYNNFFRIRKQTQERHLEELSEYKNIIIPKKIWEEFKIKIEPSNESSERALFNQFKSFVCDVPHINKNLDIFVLGETYPYLVTELENRYYSNKNHNENHPLYDKKITDGDVFLTSMPFMDIYKENHVAIISNEKLDAQQNMGSKKAGKIPNLKAILEKKYKKECLYHNEIFDMEVLFKVLED